MIRSSKLMSMLETALSIIYFSGPLRNTFDNRTLTFLNVCRLKRWIFVRFSVANLNNEQMTTGLMLRSEYRTSPVFRM